MFHITHLTMYKVHLHAGAVRVIVWLCICMEDNPLAKAFVLSSRTYAKTYNK